jgi:hypothetical protein
MEVTNHAGGYHDSHYPSCPHADVCPHCGAPKARAPYPFYPWIQRYYPWQPSTTPYIVYGTTGTNTA